LRIWGFLKRFEENQMRTFEIETLENDWLRPWKGSMFGGLVL